MRVGPVRGEGNSPEPSLACLLPGRRVVTGADRQQSPGIGVAGIAPGGLPGCGRGQGPVPELLQGCGPAPVGEPGRRDESQQPVRDGQGPGPVAEGERRLEQRAQRPPVLWIGRCERRRPSACLGVATGGDQVVDVQEFAITRASGDVRVGFTPGAGHRAERSVCRAFGPARYRRSVTSIAAGPRSSGSRQRGEGVGQVVQGDCRVGLCVFGCSSQGEGESAAASGQCG